MTYDDTVRFTVRFIPPPPYGTVEVEGGAFGSLLVERQTPRCRERSGPRGGDVEYIPVEEKQGFWRNYGKEVLGCVVIFAVAAFILVYGFGRGLLIGGTLYFAFILGVVILSAVWPFFAYFRWRRMHRIAERLTLPSVPPAEGRESWEKQVRRRRLFRIALVAVAGVLLTGTALATYLVITAPPGEHSWAGAPPGQWARIEAGTFAMGSTHREPGHRPNERQHTVTLTRDFEMSATEVRDDDFIQVMGYTSFASNQRLSCISRSGRCEPDCPARRASWHDAAAYCNALSRAVGHALCYRCVGKVSNRRCELNPAFDSPYECPGYRLPTEAEWEYAARGGTTEATYNGDITYAQLSSGDADQVLDPIAWYSRNSRFATRAVGTKRPNAFGLYDMLGNVSEWVHDWFADYPEGPVTDPWGPAVGTRRVHRGGNAGGQVRQLRVTNRESALPRVRANSISFRPVRTAPTSH